VGNFEEGVRALERARSLRALDPPPGLSDALDPWMLLAAPYRPGDAVRDLVTGEVGNVVTVAYQNVVAPSAGGAASRGRDRETS
jgi:hypothetical protein